MAIAEKLIANETVTFQSEKHWMAPIRASLIAVLMIVGFALLRMIAPQGGDGFLGGVGGFLGNLMDLIGLGLLIGGIGWIVYNVIAWRTAIFAVTNLRVIREEGLLRHRSSATLIQSISDVQTSVSVVGRQLGYGDIIVLSQAGDAGKDRFQTITLPEDFRNAIMTQKTGGMTPAPTVAAAPTSGSVVEPAAASAAPSASVAAPVEAPAASSSADAADALSRLADLRDRGAITTEEYDAKKAEILDRI